MGRLSRSGIERCVRILQAVGEGTPRPEDLSRELADAEAAEARGYYLPDEDERLRHVFAAYLEIREGLKTVLARPFARMICRNCRSENSLPQGAMRKLMNINARKAT